MNTDRKAGKKKKLLSTVFLLIAAICLVLLIVQEGILYMGARTNRQVQDLFYNTTPAPTAPPAAEDNAQTSAAEEAGQADIAQTSAAEEHGQAAAGQTAQPTAAPTPAPTPQEEIVFAANPLLDLTPEPTVPVVAGEYASLEPPREAYRPLLESNPDTVGWLKVSDIIDFPVLQRDNSYYLTHDFFGRISAEGAAFLDEGACVQPEDQHLIIHGHNMRSGNIFGKLDLYRDLEYLKNHPIITFNTLYEDRVYVPVAVFDISANPGHEKYMDLQQFNFASLDEFKAFMLDARDRSFYTIPVDLAPNDKILSLVTCSYYDTNGRMVFMLRAIRPNETAEQMARVVQGSAYKE